MRALTTFALVSGISFGGGACAVVLGTSDLEACDEDCPGGGGSGGGSDTAGSTADGTSGSNGSTTSSAEASSGSEGTSTGTGATCFLVTLTYEGITGAGRVRIDVAPEDVDFDEGTSQHCMPPGEKTIEIECRSEDDELDDYPLVVSWGNDLCPDGATCTFLLDAEQSFSLTGACD